jgi:hypothetical protein
MRHISHDDSCKQGKQQYITLIMTSTLNGCPAAVKTFFANRGLASAKDILFTTSCDLSSQLTCLLQLRLHSIS